jgi:hypothetical protein
MKTILLTQGKVAIIDDEDFEKLNKYKWCANKLNGIWYAMRTEYVDGKQKTIMMHRHIIDCPSEKIVDHINHDGLDNRQCNLRICSYSQNNKNNRGHKHNTSGLIGVSWFKRDKKWKAYIYKDNNYIHLGVFDDKIEAGKAVDKKAIELFGEFAVLNFKETESRQKL